MKFLHDVKQSEVFDHWRKVENIKEPLCKSYRRDIISPLIKYGDVKWGLFEIEEEDIDLIYQISSDDWSREGLCIPNFKLSTVVKNYVEKQFSGEKFQNIKEKEKIYSLDIDALDSRFILVSSSFGGPFTILEGNKRAVALGKLDKIIGLNAYLGLSEKIEGYFWTRHTVFK